LTTPNKGFSIKLFIPDGDASGLCIAEKSNWTGRGVVCPRILLPENKKRPDFSKTGVYVLVGPPEDAGLPKIYVGEGDPVRPRLEQHLGKKEFWTSCILFISKDENLNKAHVQYLEARLIQLARQAKRCVLDNGNYPEPPSLSESEIAEVEGFLAEMLLCFPVLGLDVFEKPAHAPSKKNLLYLKAKGIVASGYEISTGFVVLANSQAVVSEVSSIHKHLSALRKLLVEERALRLEGNRWILTQDLAFNSPSTAAGVLLGRSANGRIEWKDEQGKTLKKIQASGGIPGRTGT